MSESGTVYLTGMAPADFPTRNSQAFCAASMPRGSATLDPTPMFFAADSAGGVLHSSFLGEHMSASVRDARGRLYLAGPRRLIRFDPARLAVGQVAPACLFHAATFTSSPASPGGLMTILGSNLGPVAGMTAAPIEGRYPSSLAGTEVTVDGLSAPLLYVSDAQVNFAVPWSIRVNADQTQVCVRRGGDRKCLYADTAAASPAFFQPHAVVNQDGTLNSSENRADRGSVISLFLTGTGVLRPLPPDGAVASAPLGQLAGNCSATVIEYLRRPCLFGTCPSVPTSHPVELLYAGAAPGLIGGVTQVNVRLPAELQSTTETSLEVTIRGTAAATVRVWMR